MDRDDEVMYNRVIARRDEYLRKRAQRKLRIHRSVYACAGIAAALAVVVSVKAMNDHSAETVTPELQDVVPVKTDTKETTGKDIIDVDDESYMPEGSERYYDLRKGYRFVSMSFDSELYYDLGKLISDADLIVIGHFEENDDAEFLTDGGGTVIGAMATNTLTVERTIKGEEKDKIVISQRYAYDDAHRQIIAYSEMTPMWKDSKWLYFLAYDAENDTYHTLGDYTGRYPVDVDIDLLDRTDVSNSEKCKAFGVWRTSIINREMAAEVAKMCSE